MWVKLKSSTTDLGLIDHILAYWQAKGVDGFRCDFANYVPAEAWTFLIGQARQRDPNAFFFAEAYVNPLLAAATR